MNVKLSLNDWSSYKTNKNILIMILLKYFSRAKFTRCQIMGIPTLNIWFHLAQGAHYVNFKLILCIDDSSCKVIIPYGDPLVFYSTTKKSVRIGTWPDMTP